MELIKAAELRTGDILVCTDFRRRTVRAYQTTVEEVDSPNGGSFAEIIQVVYTDGRVEHYETERTTFQGIRRR